VSSIFAKCITKLGKNQRFFRFFDKRAGNFPALLMNKPLSDAGIIPAVNDNP
jgi:hypothetical protein